MKKFGMLVVVLMALSPPIHSAPTPSQDKESVYEVEVLVFENRLPDLAGDELVVPFDPTVMARGLDNTSIPIPATGQPYLLSVVAPLLQADGHYRILSHGHWRQTFDSDPKSTSRPIRVAATNPAELEGTVRFYMSRFLHLDVSLVYRPQSAEGTAMAVYRIGEQRRIKSQETQYFDHPQFGALIRVMPAETSEVDGRAGTSRPGLPASAR